MLVSKFESFWGFELFLAVLDDFLGPRGEGLGGSWVVVEWSLLEHFSVFFLWGSLEEKKMEEKLKWVSELWE